MKIEQRYLVDYREIEPADMKPVISTFEFNLPGIEINRVKRKTLNFCILDAKTDE